MNPSAMATPAAAARSWPAAWADARSLTRLAFPVIVAQLGMMGLGVVDMLMVARVSRTALAASAVANAWIMGTLIVGMGIVLGIDPIVSQAHGARDGRGVALGLQRGLVVALLASVGVGIAWALTEPGLRLLGQDPAIAAEAHRYVRVQIVSIPGFLGFIALRQYLMAQGRTLPPLWIVLIANVANAALNWVFIFGHLGFPAMGLVGAGVSSALTRLLMGAGLAAWIALFGLHRGAWTPWSRESFRAAGLATVLRFGIPVGVQLGLEMWAFHAATFFAGKMGTAPLGAHSVVLNLAAVSFMVPLGISIGAAALVGNRIGAGDPAGAQRSAWVAFALGAAVMVASAALFLLFREGLPRIYTPDLEVAAAAAGLLPIAAAFQLFDGVQVVGGGILRGMGRTRPAAWFNFVGYYLIALPLAWWLSLRAGFGLAGLWWGLALGIAVVAALLVAYVGLAGPGRSMRVEDRRAA